MTIEDGPHGTIWAEGVIGHDAGLLGARERVVAERLRETRRKNFVSGRMAARAAVLGLRPDLSAPEILAAEDGAPEVWAGDRLLDLSVSIAHRRERVIAAAAAPPFVIGCDIEWIEPRSEAFVADFLTSEEAAIVRKWGNPAALANLAWSAKEAVLKVRRTGLRRDTRTVEVALPFRVEPPSEWTRIGVTDLECPGPIEAWWRVREGYIQTLALGNI